MVETKIGNSTTSDFEKQVKVTNYQKAELFNCNNKHGILKKNS
jgi:hypothetical protein